MRVFYQTLELLDFNLLDLALIKFLHLLISDLSILKQAGDGYVSDLIEHDGLPADFKLDHTRLPVLYLQHELGTDEAHIVLKPAPDQLIVRLRDQVTLESLGLNQLCEIPLVLAPRLSFQQLRILLLVDGKGQRMLNYLRQ